jgi:Ribonuclease G/E
LETAVSRVEVFLDRLPGETRGVIARDGRFTHLLIDRDDDVVAHRLGARSVGRVVEAAPTLRGAFVDLGVGAPLAFLSLKGADRVAVGDKPEVVVTAEPRGGKGPSVRRTGPGEGTPRLLAAGPDVAATLAVLAPGVVPVTGIAAIDAGQEAEAEALQMGQTFVDTGLDLMLERTRALVAVDLDLGPAAGVGAGARARARANRQGLHQAARGIGLRCWAGLVAIDLIGVGHDGAAIMAEARAAFGDDEVVYGPVNRFGVMQLSLPWRRTPLEERLQDADGRRRLGPRVQDGVRSLARALLSDTASPRLALRCEPQEAELARPLVAVLGPRAAVIADPLIAAGAHLIEEVRP